jgi:hypothetical protein
MSPERREGDRGEHSADVYALGLMLLEILKGEWLPLLPMDVQEHDEMVADEVSRLGNLGMPNREWDIALRQVILQMLSGDPAQRPNAEQVAKLLRAFSEQATGESLDSFAHESVAPLARQVRGNLTGGALAGTRFVVNWFPSDGKPGSPKSAAPAPAPAPPPTPPTPTRSRGFDEDDESPTQAGVGSAVPTPNIAAPAAQKPPQKPEAAPRPTQPARPEPSRVEPQIEVSHVHREPSSGGGGGGMAIAAGGLVVVAALLCAGVAGMGGLYWFLSATPTVAEAPGTPSTSAGPTPPKSAPPTTGSAPIKVAMDGAPVQWIRVHTVLGQQVLSGQESLEGTVAADTYEITLKQVGKPALKGMLSVPEAGMSLVCKPDKDTTVSCTGGPKPVVLKPG